MQIADFAQEISRSFAESLSKPEMIAVQSWAAFATLCQFAEVAVCFLKAELTVSLSYAVRWTSG